MIHWSWTITAFVGGFVTYGIISLIAELRGRRQVAELYKREHLQQNHSESAIAEDFNEELELHKN